MIGQQASGLPKNAKKRKKECNLHAIDEAEEDAILALYCKHNVRKKDTSAAILTIHKKKDKMCSQKNKLFMWAFIHVEPTL